MEDLMDVTPHLYLFNEVHKVYFERTALSCEDDLNCEEFYRVLFHDIRVHPTIYFDVIFQLNDIYSERCAGMLCALASILRRKNQWKSCQQVLELTGKVLKFYQERCTPAPFPRHRRRVQRSQIRCYQNLTYKINDVCIDANSHTGHQRAAVQAFREACQHELSRNLAFQEQKWLTVLFSVVGPSYKDMNQKEIEEMSGEGLWQALLHRAKSASGPTYDDELKKCHGCDRIESTRGEFEDCEKCFKVSYCSYECQKRHWRVHKKNCVKRKRPMSFPWL